jgi:O-antigen/teichoic acid export membrane protein
VKRGLLAQTLHTLASMIGNQGLQIAAGIAISRIYGPPGKGLVTYAGIAILGVIAIADGLASAVARECGDDRSKGAAACAAALRIILLLTLALSTPLIALGWIVPAQHALLYVGLALPFALYIQTISGFHLVAQRIERTNFASLATNGGAALAMLVATLTVRPPIDVIMTIWTAGYIAGASIIYGGIGALSADKTAVQALFSTQIPFAIRSSSAALMTFLAARIDVFIVAATLSASSLGNYTLALACGELMWQIGRAMSWSAYGRVATTPFATAAALTAKVTRLVLAIELAAGLVAFIAGPAVFTAVYGSAFADAGPVLRFLIPGMTLYAADSILTYFISVKVGRPGIILRIEAATFALCAVGSLTTVGRFGMIGPGIATTIAYVISFAAKSYLFIRATGMSAASLLIPAPGDLRRPDVVPEHGPAVA